MKHRQCIALAVTAFVFAMFAVSAAHAAPSAESGAGVLLCNGNQILYEKNADDKHDPYGLVQIVAALTALSNSQPGDVVTYTEEMAERAGSAGLGLAAGESITMDSLITAMVVGGARDAATALAYHIGGNVESFTILMNETATALGAESSLFTNVTGESDGVQYTTARDVAKILWAAYSDAKLRALLSMPYAAIQTLDEDAATRYVYSSNAFISRFYDDRYLNEDFDGGRAASSSDGTSHNLAVFTQKQDSVYLFALLASGKQEWRIMAYSDAQALLEYALDGFEPQRVASRNGIIAEVPVKHGKNSAHLLLLANSAVDYLLPKNAAENSLSIEILLDGGEVRAPVAKGDLLGEVAYKYDGQEIARVKVVASDNISLDHISLASEIVINFFNTNVVKYGLLGFAALFLIMTLGFLFSSRSKKLQRENANGGAKPRRRTKSSRTSRKSSNSKADKTKK